MNKQEWIKSHIINRVSHNSLTREKLIESQIHLWRDEATTKEITEEVDRLLETKQLLVEHNTVVLGTVLFETNIKVSEKSMRISKKIFDNLADRRGIRQVLENLCNDVQEEMLHTIAHLIDQGMIDET